MAYHHRFVNQENKAFSLYLDNEHEKKFKVIKKWLNSGMYRKEGILGIRVHKGTFQIPCPIEFNDSFVFRFIQGAKEQYCYKEHLSKFDFPNTQEYWRDAIDWLHENSINPKAYATEKEKRQELILSYYTQKQRHFSDWRKQQQLTLQQHKALIKNMQKSNKASQLALKEIEVDYKRRCKEAKKKGLTAP